MSVAMTSSPDLRGAAVPTESIYRLTVEQYHEMIRQGILGEDEPIEFLEGWLVRKMTKNPPHTTSVGLTADALGALRRGQEWYLNTEGPVTTDDSEPEPDVAVIRGKRRDHAQRNARPKDTLMAVEVAESSLHRDRTIKKRIFARARIPVYWIVNLVDRCVEVYTDPTGPAAEPDYRQRQVYGEAEEIPVILDGQEIGRIAVRDLLP